MTPMLRCSKSCATPPRRHDLFRARFTGSYRGRSGEPVEVAVDARQLYVFDLESGVAIGPELASRPVAA